MVSAASLLPLTGAMLSMVFAFVAAFGPRRKTPTTLWFLLLNICTFLWGSAYGVFMNLYPGREVTLAVFGTTGWWLSAVVAAGAAGTFTYWFLFGAAVDARAFWLTRRGVLLAHVPAVYTLVSVISNNWLHLFSQERSGRVLYGPLGPLYQVMTLALALAGIRFVTIGMKRRFGTRNAMSVAIASAILVSLGLLWWTRSITGIPLRFNPLPAFWPLLIGVLGYEMVRFGLADIVPVATLNAIMENTDTCLALLDSEYTFVAVNGPFARGCGRIESEILGRSYFDVVPEGQRSVFESVADTGMQAVFRADPFAMGRATPRETYWDWTLSPVFDGKRRVRGLALSLTDVTLSVREQELTHALCEIQGIVQHALDAPTVLPRVTSMAAAALWADSASLALMKNGGCRIMQHCERPGSTWEPYDPEDFPLIALADREQAVVVVPDARHDPRLDPYLMELLGLRGALIVPLVAGDRLLGAISFEFRGAEPAIGEAETEFAKGLALSMAAGLQNARLYAAERKIAETLQGNMLKIPGRIPRVDFAHVYQSATESAKVGGDFYDIFETEPDRVAILIGDIAGKGIEAAVLTSLVKNTLRTEAYENGCPGEILTRSNEILRRQFDIEGFVTVFLALLDTTTGELTYSAAGHPASLLRRAGGDVLRLDASGPILGSFQGVRYSPTTLRMQDEDVLLALTDGVLEARQGGDLFGEDRVAELVGGAGVDPNGVVQSVFDGVVAFAENGLSDDVALIAVRLQDAPVRAARVS